jgi:broad specificity phosphatase PhoE
MHKAIPRQAGEWEEAIKNLYQTKWNYFMEIILLRHGESAYNALGRIQGHIDIPLSPLGMKQAQETAWRVVDYVGDKPILAVYSSDLKRSIQTSLPFIRLIRAKGQTPKLRMMEDLREINLGEWQGKTRQELLSQVEADGKSTFEKWLENPQYVIPPGAESMEEFFERVNRALNQILLENGDNEGIVVVFTHGGVISIILNVIHNRTHVNPDKYSFENAMGRILAYKDGLLSEKGEI